VAEQFALPGVCGRDLHHFGALLKAPNRGRIRDQRLA
jgi:hypothetical protein